MKTATPLAPKAHPRISLNKLGEYMQATSIRRRTIIRDQRKPPGAGILAWYSHVNATLTDYFDKPDPELLTNTIAKLKADKSGTAWQVDNRLLSAQALQRLMDILEQIDLKSVKVDPFPGNEQAWLMVAGVKVSVRPDFLIRSGEVVVGAIKLSHNKQTALNKAGCEYVATTLWRFIKETMPDAKADLKRCLAIATPMKTWASAPKSHKAKTDALEAACEEIAARWSTA